LIPFPFTDLSTAKIRPAIVLADAGRGDWVMCMITSNTYADPIAIRIASGDLVRGSLSAGTSFARPGRLFTANESLISGFVGPSPRFRARSGGNRQTDQTVTNFLG
jgi:mRNA interferase MazF